LNRVERFADTGYWIALANTRDELHSRAREWSERLVGRLVTTDAALIEVADAFSSVPWRTVAAELIEDVLSDPDVIVVPLDRTLFMQGF
jgi:predicted nucleic acid-binding protein